MFHAVLPRSALPGRAPRRLPAQVVGPAGARRVLVVEDDAADQRVLVEALAAAGYSVDTVTTGAAALARCQDHDYDAITLDLLLPDMNGLDLLAALRRGGRNSGAAVVVVTVVAEARAVAGFSVHDVLHKPLQPALLLTSLRRAGVEPGAWGGVLVVDDDPSALRLMEAALKHLGYATVCRADGESGGIRRHHPALLLQGARNSVYRIGDAEHLKALDDFGLLLLEQPLGMDDIVDHARLQPQLKTALCLDESIHTVDHAR